MATKKTPAPKRAARAVAATKAKAKPAVKSELKQQISAKIDEARDSSRERMLAGLGLISQMRKQRQERMATLVAEGKRFEPEVKKAIEELKAKLQTKGDGKGKFDLSKFKLDGKGGKFDLSKFKMDGKGFDLSKFKLNGKGIDRDAMKSRFDERIGNVLHRIGLPTRKEVDALSKKVDKLAELQRA